MASDEPTTRNWRRHFFYRKLSLKTTWKLRLAAILMLAAIVVLPRAFWARQIGRSLVCKEQVERSDALLLENFDVDYLVFERAAALQKSGIAPRVFVPTAAGSDPSFPNEVSHQFVEGMARAAKLEKFQIIPIQEIEPISLNAALQIRDFLKKEGIESVVVISPGFRSRRSAMVYNAVLAPAGIQVGCVPVFGPRNAENWTSTWHGIQDTVEQFLKLQYYRFYVLL